MDVRGHDRGLSRTTCLRLVGEAVFEVYGIKSTEEMTGKTIRTPYDDFPDICGGTNFYIEGFTSIEAAMNYNSRHHHLHKETSHDS